MGFGFWGGGSADFIFVGARIFLIKTAFAIAEKSRHLVHSGQTLCVDVCSPEKCGALQPHDVLGETLLNPQSSWRKRRKGQGVRKTSGPKSFVFMPFLHLVRGKELGP